MNSGDFEKRLERQTIRPIPGEWRQKILQTANDQGARSDAPNHQLKIQNSKVNNFLTELLWPCPQVWAGLAAVWLVILTLNFAMREPGARIAKTASPSPEVIAVLKEQRRIYLELAGLQLKENAEPPKKKTPGPSSERKIEFQIV